PAPARLAPVFSISTTVGGPLVPRDSPLNFRYSEDAWFLDTAVKSMSVTPPRHIPPACTLSTAISANNLVRTFPGFETFTLREIDCGLHSGEISLPENARADLGTLVAAIVQAHQKGHDEREGRQPDAFYEASQHTCALDAASPNTGAPDGDSWATKVRKGSNAPRGRGQSS
ncbi:unnamed protein product, partial [Pylaiella littoralis]